MGGTRRLVASWVSAFSAAFLGAFGLVLGACSPPHSVGAIVAVIPVDAAPSAGVAAENAAVWVPSDLDGSISRLDPATNKVSATIQPGTGHSCSLCLGAVATQSGAVWATASSARLSLVGIDRLSNQVTTNAPLPVFPSAVVAASDGTIWLASVLDSTVVQIDPISQRVLARLRVPRPSRLAASDDAVWVISRPDLSDNGLVIRIDPRTDFIAGRLEVGLQPTAIAYGEGSLWVIDEGSQRLQRIDPLTNSIVGSVPTGFLPVGVAVGEGSVWVISQSAADVDGPALSRIDPGSGAVVGNLTLGEGTPVGVAVGAGSVWIASRSPDSVIRVRPAGASGSGSGGSPLPFAGLVLVVVVVVVVVVVIAASARGGRRLALQRGRQLASLRRFSEKRHPTR